MTVKVGDVVMVNEHYPEGHKYPPTYELRQRGRYGTIVRTKASGKWDDPEYPYIVNLGDGELDLARIEFDTVKV